MHSALITHAGRQAISCVKKQKGKKSKQRAIRRLVHNKNRATKETYYTCSLVMTYKAWWKDFVSTVTEPRLKGLHQ